MTHDEIEALRARLSALEEAERELDIANETAVAMNRLAAENDDLLFASQARASALQKALDELVKKLDLCAPAMTEAFVFQAVHGIKYSGPTYGDELDAARVLSSASASGKGARLSALEKAGTVFLSGLLPAHRDLYAQEIARMEAALSGQASAVETQEKSVGRTEILIPGRPSAVERDAGIPGGYVLVPRELSDEMREAYYDLIPIAPGTETWAMAKIPHAGVVYEAFLNAASLDAALAQPADTRSLSERGFAEVPLDKSPEHAELFREGNAKRDAAASAVERDAVWLPITTAPKDGTEIVLFVPGEAGTGRPLVGHWARGGGEEQPRFGPAWFVWSGFHFRELAFPPMLWMPLPARPSAALAQPADTHQEKL